MKKGKSTWKTIATAIAIICLVIPGSYLLLDAVLVNAKIADLPGGFFTLSTVGGQPIIPAGDQISVDRTIKISYIGQESQAVLATHVFDVVRPDGSLYEVLTTTDSAGQTTSVMTYKTGDHYWLYDTTTFQTQEIVIPSMAKSTAEGTTAANPILVYGHTAETFTDLLARGATTYANDADMNYTAYPTGTFVYSLAPVTDDRACVGSPRDALLRLNGNTFPENNMLFVVLSEGDYASAVINSMDGSYNTGSAHVWYKVLPDIYCDKDGNTYKPGKDGSLTVSIPFDFSGMSSATNTTMQIWAFSNGVWQYAVQYYSSGSTASFYGPHALQLGETALTLYK